MLQAKWFSSLSLFALAAAVAVGLVTFLEPESDAVFRASDPVHAAWRAENAMPPPATGLLMELVARWASPWLGEQGLHAPGSFVLRLLSALSTAGILLVLLTRAGPGRRLEALAVSALPFLSFCFVQEGANGETVAAGTFTMLLALERALAPGKPRWWLVGALLVLATLARQDASLTAPVIALTLAARWQPAGGGRALRQRVLAATTFLLVTGGVSFCCFWAAWSCYGEGSSLMDWLQGLSAYGREPFEAWAQYPLGWERLSLLHISARHAFDGFWNRVPIPYSPEHHALHVLMPVIPLLLAWAGTRRATRNPWAPGWGPCLAAFAAYGGFYLWFEPNNFERLHPLLALVLLAACCRLRSAAPSSVPAWERRAACLAAAVVLGLFAWQRHAEESLESRRPHLQRSVARAREWVRDHPGTQVITPWEGSRYALAFGGVPVEATVPIGAEMFAYGEIGRPLLLFMDTTTGMRENIRAQAWAFCLPLIQALPFVEHEASERGLLFLARPALDEASLPGSGE